MSETAPDAFAALTQFASGLERRQLEGRLKKQSRLWKPTATSATMLGYECERRIVYQRVTPWRAEAISAELASIFEEGNMHERQVVRELEEELGVKLRERGASFRDRGLDIVGALDFEALVDGVGWVPTEVKGLTFIPGDDVDDVDLSDAPSALHRRYFSQLQIYLFLKAKEFGLFIFKSKTTGRWRVIGVRMDLEHVEKLLKRAERVRDAVSLYERSFSRVFPFTQDGPSDGAIHIATNWDEATHLADTELPERLLSRSECARCPFQKSCNPSQAPVDPALIMEDQDLIAMLNRRQDSKDAWKTYANNHKWIRERIAMTGGDVFFAGQFRIEKKPHGNGWQMKITQQEVEHGNDDERENAGGASIGGQS